MDNPIRMDDLGVPPILKTSILGNPAGRNTGELALAWQWKHTSCSTAIKQ